MKSIIFSKFSNERAEQFKIRTDIVEDLEGKRFVQKIPLTEEANIHLENIHKNFQSLSEVYKDSKMCINKCCKIDNGLEFEYITGTTLEEELDGLLYKKDYIQIVEKIREYVSLLESSIDEEDFKPTEEFIKIFGNVKFDIPLKSGNVNDIDLNFNNIILGEHWNVIDYEWTFKFPIPLNYIIYRAIFWYINNSEKRSELKELGLYKLLGITDQEIVQYGNMEMNFQNYVLEDLIPLNNLYGTTTKKNVNIQEIIERESIDGLKNEVQIFYDYGNGFSEEQSYKLNHLLDDNGKINFEIPLKSNIRQIRVDPANYSSIVNVDRIIGYATEYYSIDYITNGIRLNNTTTLFATNDPQIIIQNIKEGTVKLELKFDVQIISKESTIQLCQFIQNKDAQITELNNETLKLKQEITESKNEKLKLKEEIELVKKEKEKDIKGLKDEIDTHIQGLKDEIDTYKVVAADRKELANRLIEIENAYTIITKSSCWKITKPLRTILDLLKKVQHKVFNIEALKIKAYNVVNLKSSSLIYNIDSFNYQNNILIVQGWIFDSNKKIKNLILILNDGKKEYRINVLNLLERLDVYNAYNHENSLLSGFSSKIRIKNLINLSVYLEIDEKDRIFINDIRNLRTEEVNLEQSVKDLIIEPIDDSFESINFIEFKKENTTDLIEYPEEIFKYTIDIIIPIYNGYEYLEKLFNTIVKTKMKYRIIVINDKSPDKRVEKFLEKYLNSNEVIIIENEENLGFVKTVNKGFNIATNHVALLNTDIELPDKWLERLMSPILLNKNVASSTPFTNSGTICSFPNFCEDNLIFENLDVNTIDLEFQSIKPNYTNLPTGIGFCMGINRNILDIIGNFDADTFNKGYGEENDWCQRAIKAGYRNVHVENLYVYHKHGGSFLSEDKKKFLEENSILLSKKHPNYNSDVASFCSVDPVKDIRNHIMFKILTNKSKGILVYFDHNLGGGATSYLKSETTKRIANREDIIIIRYDTSLRGYLLNYKYKMYNLSYYCVKFDDVINILSELKISKIYINELVTYPNIYDILKTLLEFKRKKDIKIIMLLHDLFSICPTINLLNDKGCYCNIPNIEVCEECLRNNQLNHYPNYDSMDYWRKSWNDFLSECDDIIAFSENSKTLLQKSYGLMSNISVIPHSVDYMVPLNKEYKYTNSLNIGLLGVLGHHKGLDIIKKMLEEIEKANLNINIILIGSALEVINHKNFKQTGIYTTDMIPKLVLENDIDLFFIPSIWPETFSYTTQEIINMNLPIVSFNIGAPVERIKKYSKGMVLNNFDAKDSLDTIIDFSKSFNYKSMKNMKILFVAEYISFSSRYRVEHFREQLLINGIESDFTLIENIEKYNIEEYKTIIIYRCRYNNIINSFIKECHEKDKKVFYDIDDYIFEYDKIKNLDFLAGEDYIDFDKYSLDIFECMKCSDGFITSTENMKKAIEQSLINKPVCVNRNVASLEMLTVSLKAKNEVIKDKEKIIIGYFSGSKTHDNDFEIIADVLGKILKNNVNVYLKIAGCLNLPKEFAEFKQRIEFIGFVHWKELPYLIASVDINLLPVEDTFFHSCKSENKWTEAALVCVPTVASYNTELERVITDGQSGMLCKTEEEWESKLNKLISDDSCRNRMAQNAHEVVLNKYITFNSGTDAIKFIINKEL